MSTPVSTRRISLIHRDHRRTFQENLYVYAVVSRRSKGVSIGINLNPDKVCNFDCIYCQVDRTTPAVVRKVDMNRLRDELEDMLDLVMTELAGLEDRTRELRTSWLKYHAESARQRQT